MTRLNFMVLSLRAGGHYCSSAVWLQNKYMRSHREVIAENLYSLLCPEGWGGGGGRTFEKSKNHDSVIKVFQLIGSIG